MSYSAEDVQKFATTIGEAQNIIVTAHLFPDYDAVCSALLLTRTLQHNYPQKRIHLVLEDEPRDGVLPDGTLEITRMSILKALQQYDVDCLILTDTNRYDRVTREEKAALLAYIAQRSVKTIVIDHHERQGEDSFTVHLQDPAIPAATQIVYQLCFHSLKLQKPANIAPIAMLGIVDDSGLFAYTYDNYSDTFLVVNELIKDGASVEQAALIMNHLSIEQMTIIGELASNMKAESTYAYSFISDDFIQKRLHTYDPIDFKAACTMFGNRYITAIIGRKWGFILYPNPAGAAGEYHASFRSQADSQNDITEITSRLGAGSGHKHAAGATIKAANAQEALQKVKDAISSLSRA